MDSMENTIEFEMDMLVLKENSLKCRTRLIVNGAIERIFYLRGIAGDVGE